MNRSTKNLVLASIFLLLANFFVTGVAAPTEKGSLWSVEPEVLSQKRDACWWLDGYREEKTSLAYLEAAEKLNNAFYTRTSPVVREHLSQIFVNPYNNTVFVVVKGLDEFVKKELLAIMDPKSGVEIIFKNGVATLEDLETWASIIVSNWDDLEALGIKILKTAVSESGKIKVGVKDLDREKVNELVKFLENKVPKGVLVIYNMDPIVLTGQADEHRPVIGGIKETSYSDYTSSWCTATIGFYVTWNSGSNEGVLIAGHASSSTTTDVHQPIRTNKIGDVEIIGNDDHADIALVEFDGGISGTPNIYCSGISVNVTGEKSYSSITIGDDVEFCGLASGIETCEIDDKGSIYHPEYGTLQQQLTIDYECQLGDSGGPLYQTFYEPSEGIYTARAYGTEWGKTSGESYCNSIDGIENDLNENLNFADTS